MNAPTTGEVRVQIDQLVIEGRLPGASDARALEAAIAMELQQFISGVPAGGGPTRAAYPPALKAVARQIAAELYRKVGR